MLNIKLVWQVTDFYLQITNKLTSDSRWTPEFSQQRRKHLLNLTSKVYITNTLYKLVCFFVMEIKEFFNFPLFVLLYHPRDTKGLSDLLFYARDSWFL